MRYNLYRAMVVQDKDDDIEYWFSTKTGLHIPVKKGQTKEEATREKLKEVKEKSQKTDTEKPEKSSVGHTGEGKKPAKTVRAADNEAVKAIINRAKKSKHDSKITVDYIKNQTIKTGKYTKEAIETRIKNYDTYFNSGKKQTIETHTTGGKWEDNKFVDYTWKPERVKDVWEEILSTEEVGKDDKGNPIYKKIDWESKMPKKGQKPKLVILGGRGGSGKSHFTDGSLGKNGYKKDEFLVIDPDSYKERLPEYKDLIDSGSEYGGLNAWEVHEESSDMKKAQLDIALKKGVNVVLDGTLSKYDSTKKILDKFKSNDYIIDVAFMELPREISAVRGLNRGMRVNKTTKVPSGRFVPLDVMVGMTECEENFAKLCDDADNWVMYDNEVPEGEMPKFVAKGGKNG